MRSPGCCLREHGIRISVDGADRWVDNVFVERLWRSLKYEEVYLKATASPRRTPGSGAIWPFFNGERRHQLLGRKTLDAVYFESADQRDGGITGNTLKFRVRGANEVG